MSPYYLHASDHLGQLFVIELIHDGNYGKWIADMSNAFFAKNMIGFVDGTIPMPSVNSSNLTHWMRSNAMVKGWFKNVWIKRSEVVLDMLILHMKYALILMKDL